MPDQLYSFSEIPMSTFAKHVQGKDVVKDVVLWVPLAEDYCAGIELSDGSCVVMRSRHNGPFPADTPSDTEPPAVFLGVPASSQ